MTHCVLEREREFVRWCSMLFSSEWTITFSHCPTSEAARTSLIFFASDKVWKINKKKHADSKEKQRLTPTTNLVDNMSFGSLYNTAVAASGRAKKIDWTLIRVKWCNTCRALDLRPRKRPQTTSGDLIALEGAFGEMLLSATASFYRCCRYKEQ